MAKAATDTKEKTQAQPQNIAQEQPPREGRALSPLQQTRIPYHPIYKERYGVDGAMWRALVDAVYPSAKTPEGVILAVSYCQARKYDVMKKMVHVVPIWSTSLQREVEGVWEAVSALRATAFRTGEYVGCDETTFGPMIKKHFKGQVGKKGYEKTVEMDLEFPEWAQITVYRFLHGEPRAFPGPKVHWLGAYGCQGKSDVPNDKWSEGGGSYMLEKCAEAAALRKAFPEALGSMNAAEEMEGRKIDFAAGPIIDHEPPPERPTRASAKAQAEKARDEDEQRSEQYRQTVQEPEPAKQPAEADDDAGEQVDDTTGEVTEREPDPDSTESASPTTSATPPSQGQAGPPEDKTREHVGFAKMLTDKVKKSSTRKNLDAVLHDFTQEFDLLRTDAPALYKGLMDEVEAKKAWFAK